MSEFSPERRLFIGTLATLIGGGAATSLWNAGRRARKAQAWSGTIALGTSFNGADRDEALIVRVQHAFFARLTDHGGINGRRVNFLSLDDGGDRSRRAQNLQMLHDRADILATVGTRRLPGEDVPGLPQLFVRDQLPRLVSVDGIGHGIGFRPAARLEGEATARLALKGARRGVRVAIHADGSAEAVEWAEGVRAALPGDARVLVESQVDHVFAAGTPATIRPALRLGGSCHIPNSTALALYRMAEADRAVFAKCQSLRYLTDGHDPAWTNAGTRLFHFQEYPLWVADAGTSQLNELAKAYLPDLEINDEVAQFAYCTGALMETLLGRCGSDFTRRRVAAESLQVGEQAPHLVAPGIRFYTSSSQLDAIAQAQPIIFDGSAWNATGAVIDI